MVGPSGSCRVKFVSKPFWRVERTVNVVAGLGMLDSVATGAFGYVDGLFGWLRWVGNWRDRSRRPR